VPFVDSDFSAQEARDMLDYWRWSADLLATLGQDGAMECAQAYDNVQHALRMRGLL
jgi:hypothetical protein